MNWVDDSHIWIEITSWDIWINWWWYCGRINQIFLISPKRAGPRKHQSKPVQSSFPSTFFHYFLPNQKNKSTKTDWALGTQQEYFYQKPATKILPTARIKRPRSRRRNFKRKPKPKAPGRCFWPRILTKKPMEKEVDSKVEPQHFYFCCRARHFANFEGILEVLRKKRWNPGWCFCSLLPTLKRLQRKTDRFSRLRPRRLGWGEVRKGNRWEVCKRSENDLQQKGHRLCWTSEVEKGGELLLRGFGRLCWGGFWQQWRDFTKDTVGCWWNSWM